MDKARLLSWVLRDDRIIFILGREDIDAECPCSYVNLDLSSTAAIG